MDVRDLLKSANPALKRTYDKNGHSNEESHAKVQKSETDNHYQSVDLDDEEIGELEQQKVDASMFVHYGKTLEKRYRANQEARTKFNDQPEKFMESELELQETLEEMQILASEPSYYSVLASNTSAPTILLSLLSHENTDMSLTVIDLLNALLDSTGLIEAGEESVAPFLKALIDGQLINLLCQNLCRLDENNSDESEGIFKSIGIVENLIDARPSYIQLVYEQGFFSWLLKILKDRKFTKNKLYASEVLDSILLGDSSMAKHLGEMDGIDFLLQKLSVYKRHDPTTYDEAEMLQNLFNCLCTCLMVPENKERFLVGEGIQLMNLMLRERHLSRDTALRILDYCMCLNLDEKSSPDYAEKVVINNCIKFVEILGLRTIFPLFMHFPKAKMLKFTSKGGAGESKANDKSAIGPTSEQMEEHIINIVAALLRFCPTETKDRVLNKFVENDHEKVDRIVELHFKYLEKMDLLDKKLNHIRYNTDRLSDLSEEELVDFIASKKLDNGQITHQMIACIILDICVEGNPSIRDRVMQLFRMRKASLSSVTKISEEYTNNLGDQEDLGGTEKLTEYKRVRRLMQKFAEYL